MQITIQTSTEKIERARADLFILPMHEGDFPKDVLPAAATAAIQKKLKTVSFTGKWASAEIVPYTGQSDPLFAAFAGMGDVAKPDYYKLEGLRRALGGISSDARKHVLRSVAFQLPDTEAAASIAAAAVEAFELSNYRFAEYKRSAAKEQSVRGLQRIIFVTSPAYEKDVQKTVKKAQQLMRGVTSTRDLVNQPASHMAPKVLVSHARAIVRQHKNITARIMNRQQAEKQGFNAFLAVARGSKQEPYVIHLKYKPKKKAKKKIFIVGKGITFDSGGLSLKPAQYMEDMKIDMAGAATVLGLFAVLSDLNLEVEVHGVIAACENMPSGDAYRPGDILTAKNGKTIEVLNTDAEGRITLADALSYAVEQKPDVVIDLATLTGACAVAVGATHAGLWSNNEELQETLMVAARHAGEGVVAFPLPEEYRQTIESKIADVRNTATMQTGGATTAALFLQEFVGNAVWAHFDIAAPVYAERPMLPYYGIGGTGYGVRTLIRYLEDAA